MTERRMAYVQQARAQQEQYIKSGTGTGATAADQIASAKSLLDSGAITKADYDALKAKALS